MLKNISLLWAMLYTLVLFLTLFESRYPKKKTILISVATMIPLVLVNLVLFAMLGMGKYGTLMLLTLSLPSCVVFWILAKHRDGRFFFTFCMVDTVVLEILYITNIIDHYTTPETNLVMFLIRLVVYPLLTFLAYKYLRPMYRKVQTYTKKGWGLFAIIGFLFYLAITLMMTYPIPVTERDHQLPALCILFALMPVIYLHIIGTLRHQHLAHQMEQQENIMKLQVEALTERLDALSSADERFRIERHDFRHKLQTIGALVEREEYGQLRKLTEEYSDDLDRTRIEMYSQFPVLDAALAAYIRKAEKWQIPVTHKLQFPDELPVPEAELATVLANALENAIHACQKAEVPFIKLQAINTPRFMLRITNRCGGDIQFDENNVPTNYEEGHGFGTRSIVAFCEKYGVFYEFEAKDDTFSLQLIFS